MVLPAEDLLYTLFPVVNTNTDSPKLMRNIILLLDTRDISFQKIIFPVLRKPQLYEGECTFIPLKLFYPTFPASRISLYPITRIWELLYLSEIRDEQKNMEGIRIRVCSMAYCQDIRVPK